MILRLRSLILLFLLISTQSDSSAVTVAADEIRQKVISGEPVMLDGVTVSGCLNLSGIEPRIVRREFVITNSEIGDADLSGLEFKGDVNLTGTRIGDMNFASSVFSQGAFFDLIEVSGDASFEGAQFKRDASFSGAAFSGAAEMNHTVFDDYGYFAGSSFLEGLHISSSSFQGFADFYGARISGDFLCLITKFGDGAGFMNAEFNGDANFGMSSFAGYTSFDGSVFKGDANFALTRFDKAVYLGDMTFEGDAIFGLAQFEGLANFAGTHFMGDLNLNSASIDALILDNTTFGSASRINLKGAEFRRLTAPWSHIKDHILYDGATYLALVKNYQGLEWFEDADDCYYDYRREAQLRKPLGWGKIIDYLAWITCGYGVRPSYPFLWSIVLMALFGMAFYLGKGIRRQPAAREENPEHLKEAAPTEGTPASLHESIYFSALVYLYSTSSVDFRPSGIYRYLVILEGILGWFFLSLFLVSLGRVMIR
ncbi:MAG: pentapeptide repeat-containing protein [Methanothrix sp.]|uniref:pentapeptide repeat-containing protein n=1 Tax=Methanothrix sp. TaxID=90426 RepID=UPI0025E98ABF|nr:pentapeptide repeat-containing protein [Methanothrix sp.]MCQ8902690.1 pentapeptide repeat-containing protein [Methanothrix sp.]